MPTIPTDAVEPGDILLVTKHPGDALADLIVDLDQSETNFSHAGLAGDEGEIICSYPRWTVDDPVDIGGIYHMPFSHFFERTQSIYRLQLPEGVTRDKAAKALEDYPEDREGAFGYAKCAMVAATLHTLASVDRIGEIPAAEILDLAMVAAAAWSSDTDFYCAEFVAYLYGLELTVGQLRPPRPLSADLLTGHELSHRHEIELGFGAWVLSRLATQRQAETLKELIGVVKAYNPEFFTLGFQRLDEIAAPYLRPSFIDTPKIYDHVVVPPALVTPRMLEKWGDGKDVIEGSPDAAVSGRV